VNKATYQWVHSTWLWHTSHDYDIRHMTMAWVTWLWHTPHDYDTCHMTMIYVTWLCHQSTSLSSVSCTWPLISVWEFISPDVTTLFFASSSFSTSCHIFICFMLGAWLSRTIFWRSRKFFPSISCSWIFLLYWSLQCRGQRSWHVAIPVHSA